MAVAGLFVVRLFVDRRHMQRGEVVVTQPILCPFKKLEGLRLAFGTPFRVLQNVSSEGVRIDFRVGVVLCGNVLEEGSRLGGRNCILLEPSLDQEPGAPIALTISLMQCLQLIEQAQGRRPV